MVKHEISINLETMEAFLQIDNSKIEIVHSLEIGYNCISKLVFAELKN